MRRFFVLVFTMALSLGLSIGAGAQETRDVTLAPAVDSTLIGKSIFNLLPNVTVHQSQAILASMNRQISSNSSRRLSGYRVRIFNDNKQNSRGASEAAMGRFKGMYPGIAAYRTYSNPFFKVTVGDFRTKSEAMRLLQQVKGSFPSAFIVKETINYPPVGSIF
ncbi:MAG: SPOR domain-containing protein [Bacteroidales bacterium]|nr:SPOR domain-containing protein [Bacteroidales bacterium]